MSPVTTIPSPSSAMKKNGHERAFFGDIPSKKDAGASFGNNCLKGSYNDFEYRSFSGKGKNWESGFHLPRRGFEHLNDKYNAVKNYGARYYWSEMLTGWLSVDPMMDKYPSISPYAYCALNPAKLVDPDGNCVIDIDDIVITGSNNSNVTIKTDLVDCSVNVNHDFGGKFTLEGEEVLSAALDLAGIFDPIGVCDGANAILQAQNGDFGNAFLSVAGLIPYVGDLAKIGKVGKDYKIIQKAISSCSSSKPVYNFTKAAEKHMADPNRYVPVSILDETIKHPTMTLADPQGTNATMYYSTIERNNKSYNLEVLYDSKTNTIMHFKYSE